MKLQVLADLHLEFAPITLPATDADVTILAGDVDVGVRGMEWILSHFRDNHEFYHHDLFERRRSIAQLAEGTNVHLLDN